MVRSLRLGVFCDGDDPDSLSTITDAISRTWKREYASHATLTIEPAVNLKQAANRTKLPPSLLAIEKIRNPDIFFVELATGMELGGIEITTHSPDGSNIEKRYPFLWVSGRTHTTAFVATPYLKRRPGGQTNRLPRRHSERNLQFLLAWDPAQPQASFLRQFVPMKELQLGDLNYVPLAFRSQLITWADLGDFFAHLLAAKALPKSESGSAIEALSNWKAKLQTLAEECVKNADRRAEASTLLCLPDRWIQVYNSRPDSGHWERGEGQFDSIDGRLMFTLDEIEFMPRNKRPSRMEFWLPQMVSTHPWIAEQRQRGHESKRLRNILVDLAPVCKTKFAEDLTEDDWALLRANSRLLLERKDWEPKIFSVADLVKKGNPKKIAEAGISSAPASERTAIEALLRDPRLYYCAMRAYISEWPLLLTHELASIPRGSVVLVPRIPARLLAAVNCPDKVKLVAAESCTKAHLKMLRQLHRYVFA